MMFAYVSNWNYLMHFFKFFFLGLTGGLAAPFMAAGAGAIIGGAGAAALGSATGIAVIGSLFGVAGAGLTGIFLCNYY